MLVLIWIKQNVFKSYFFLFNWCWDNVILNIPFKTVQNLDIINDQDLGLVFLTVGTFVNCNMQILLFRLCWELVITIWVLHHIKRSEYILKMDRKFAFIQCFCLQGILYSYGSGRQPPMNFIIFLASNLLKLKSSMSILSSNSCNKAPSISCCLKLSMWWSKLKTFRQSHTSFTDIFLTDFGMSAYVP